MLKILKAMFQKYVPSLQINGSSGEMPPSPFFLYCKQQTFIMAIALMKKYVAVLVANMLKLMLVWNLQRVLVHPLQLVVGVLDQKKLLEIVLSLALNLL